jgi:uncharacterized protein YdcH (DUF465 family)
MDSSFRQSRAFDRIWRLIALFILCALVYYFSFDNGRQTSKAQVERLMAENESLRTQLALQSADIDNLRQQRNQLQDELTQSAQGETGETGASGNEEPQNSPDSSVNDAKPPEISRLQLRVDDNKLILDSQVLLSLGKIDITDETIVVKVLYLDTDRRETRTMEQGDSFLVTKGEASYRLILDKLTGSQATFLLVSS